MLGNQNLRVSNFLFINFRFALRGMHLPAAKYFSLRATALRAISANDGHGRSYRDSHVDVSYRAVLVSDCSIKSMEFSTSLNDIPQLKDISLQYL